MSRMFSFITETWNPLGGECPHKCEGCWARAIAEKYNIKKYSGPPFVDQRQLRKRFRSKDFVFVQDMSDLFADKVTYTDIVRILYYFRENPYPTFLLLTKNPKRYLEFDHYIPRNCVLGATIESNRDQPRISLAPKRSERIEAMTKLHGRLKRTHRLFVSIEPIMAFDLNRFTAILKKKIKPDFVAIGYDNYKAGYPEPKKRKAVKLANRLSKAGITVYLKTIREKREIE